MEATLEEGGAFPVSISAAVAKAFVLAGAGNTVEAFQMSVGFYKGDTDTSVLDTITHCIYKCISKHALAESPDDKP